MTSDRTDPSIAAKRSEHRCRPYRHVFPPFRESSDLGGGAQRCECGNVLIDKTLGGGRVVEMNDGILRGR